MAWASVSWRRSTLLQYEPTELLSEWLYNTRPLSGNLYPSMDLLGSLRHVMLRVVGAPTRKPEDLLSLVRLETGTMWHDKFEAFLRRKQIPVMLETNLKPYLPAGWSGRADWITWSDEYKAFVLGDLKTIKPEGMGYIRRDGAKQAHLWQLSSYFYALEKMGLPLVKAFHIYYLPMGPLSTGEEVKPELIECAPLDRDLVLGTMVDRAAAVKEYMRSLPWIGEWVDADPDTRGPLPSIDAQGFDPTATLTDGLAPVQDRVQALRWDGKKGVFNLMLLPDWSTNYCLYPSELCDCHTQGQTKLGHWMWDASGNGGSGCATYVARKGFEDADVWEITSAQAKKLKEANASQDAV